MSTANIYDMASRQPNELSPEAIYISALIDSGTYVPSKHGISDRHFTSWQQVHTFCTDYQTHAGKSPTAQMITSRFPSFPYTHEPQVDDGYLSWTAEQLSIDTMTRNMRSGMLSAIRHLGEDDYHKALAELNEVIRTSTPRAKMGRSFSEIDTRASMDFQPAPVCLNHSDSLEQITGGIRPGNLWFVAARLSVGKSWILQQMAVAAAEAGWNVNFFSLEMTEEEVADRLHRIALRDVPNFHQLPNDERMERLNEWQQTNGSIYIRDPSYGPLDATEIAACHAPETITVIDYATLMKPTASMSRNAEHWQSAAGISKELKQTALAHSIPIISAAQINRAGANSEKAPGAEHLAESDQLGRDADVVITMRRESRRVLMCNLAKNRHGNAGRRWHVILDPANGKFGEIDRDKAFELIEQDIAQDEG
jgi:hypothetical protein